MNKPTTSGDDLLILARRGELSEPEQRRLEVYLGASALSRALYKLGIHYDAAGQGRQNDAEMIERAIAAVSQRRTAPAQRRSRRGWVIGVVAALSSVSAAAATVTVARWVARTPAPTSIATPSAGGAAPSRGKGSGASGKHELAAALAPNATLPEDQARPSDAGESSTQAPAGPSSARAPADVDTAMDTPGTSRPNASAAQMFSEANALRKAGRLSEAQQAYRRLQHAHAGSSEAAVSHVLLGRILLREGRAAAASAEFERYLNRRDRGNLAEEALQGDAMCMRALGRPAAERAVWQRLLARFPGSIYADAARQRLKDLDAANGSRP